MLIAFKKTGYMVVSKKETKFSLNMVNDQVLISFSSFTEDARCEYEIKSKSAMSKFAFLRLSNILRNRNISMKTMVCVLQWYVYLLL